jgi:hypothetical protein
LRNSSFFVVQVQRRVASLTGEFLPFVWIILGLVTFSLLAFICIVVGCIIVFVWKVAVLGWVYLVILALMFVGAALSLIPFIGFLQTLQTIQRLNLNESSMSLIFRHVSGAPNVILYFIFVVLAINMFFALLALLGKKMSERGEKVFVVVFVVIAVLVLLPA